MKTLYLLRHAHSPIIRGGQDFERPLGPEGVDSLERVAENLQDLGSLPTHVVCSGSRRTRETLAGIESILPNEVKVHYDDDLYLAKGSYVIDVIEKSPPSAEAVLIISHGPTVEEAARWLLGMEGRVGAPVPFTSGAFGRFGLEIDAWTDVYQGCAVSHTVLSP